jgi:hypothetical protein
MKPNSKISLAVKKRNQPSEEVIEKFGNQAETVTQRKTLEATTKIVKTNSIKKNLNPNPLEQPSVKRDTFTMPLFDYDLINQQMSRSAKNSGVIMNKSEIVRAGLIALSCMTDIQFEKAVKKVVKIKTGRPGKLES